MLQNSRTYQRHQAASSPEEYYRQAAKGNNPSLNPGHFQGNHDEHRQPMPSMFDEWNQKLLQLGIPRWNIGDHVVEPLQTACAVFVLLFFGLQGLLLMGLLYFVVKMSQQTRGRRGTNPSSSTNSNNSNRRPGDAPGPGTGRRLGRI